MKMHAWALVAVASLGACASAYPPQPQVVGVALPPSGTAVAIPGYAQAVGGYLTGTFGEIDGDVAKASEGYIAALMEDPDNPDMRERVFESSLLAGDIPNALRVAKTMPRESDGGAMPALVRAVGNIKAGNIREARQMMRSGLLATPDLLPFRLLESYLSVAEGRPVREEVADLLALPGPAAVQSRKLYHAARLWLKEGDTAAATQVLEAANTLEPGGLFTTLLLGNLYEREGRTGDAIALYRVFREKNPQVALLEGEEQRIAQGRPPPPFVSALEDDVAAALFDFGLMVWAQGAATPARELLNLALWLSPADPYLLYYSAIVEEFSGARDVALARYAAVPADSSAGLAARMRAIELAFKDAKPGSRARNAELDRMRALQQAHPHALAPRRSLAEMAFDNRDYALAARAYGALLESGRFDNQPPMLAALHFARGASYERQKMYDKAAADLKASLSHQPNNPNVLNYLGYMWAEQGINLPEALAMLQKALALAPDDGAIVDSLGWAYFRSGDTERGLLYLEQAADMVPDDPTVAEHLGDAYARKGDRAEALRHWRRALQLNDESAWPEDELKARVTRKLH